MFEVVVLFFIGLVWVVAASVQDIKTREVANWLNFSLIVFVLGFRFFWSLFESGNFMFFYNGLIGFGIFLVLGNLFYYSRIFAGGDAKLMIALGTVLSFSESFYANIKTFVIFLGVFLVIGAVYSLSWSFYLSFKNYKNFKIEFGKRFREKKSFVYALVLFGFLVMVSGIFEGALVFIGLLIVLLPFLYVYSKAVDESSMVKKVNTSKLTEGDWLYKDVKIGKRLIKANWDGLSKEDILFLKKRKKEVVIRQGIPFVPVFLISYVLVFLAWFFYNSVWSWI